MQSALDNEWPGFVFGLLPLNLPVTQGCLQAEQRGGAEEQRAQKKMVKKENWPQCLPISPLCHIQVYLCHIQLYMSRPKVFPRRSIPGDSPGVSV